MITIEHQLHDILLRHLWQLPGEDVFQIDQELHLLMCAIVADHCEIDYTLILLILRTLIT